MLYVTDKGDPSVGVFEATWEVDPPFIAEKEDKDIVELFREMIISAYQPFTEGRITAVYEHEFKNECSDYDG